MSSVSDLPGLAPGSAIGGFVVESLIGEGAMGRVYRAHQGGVDRAVAVKVLQPALAADPGFVRRFRREAGLMRDLDHPALLPVYAAGEDGGRLYLVTRLVRGMTLAAALDDGPLGPSRAVTILTPVAGALDHANGVVHRDVKPANILLDHDGRPFLADFGISREIGAGDVTASSAGTPRYMAPEQAGAEGTGHRADLYSLACVAFEMLTGRPPFTDRDTVALLLAHASRPVPRASSFVPSLPHAVDDVLVRGMAKRPEQRYGSARELVRDLLAALSVPPKLPVPPPGPAPPRRPVQPGSVQPGSVQPGSVPPGSVPAGSVPPARRTPMPPAPEWLTDAPAPPRRRRHLAALVATGLAVAVAVGAVLVGVRDSDGTPPAPANAAGSPAAASPVDLADLRRGGELYRAALDGTTRGFIISPATETTSAREQVRFVPGALELEAYAGGAETYSELGLDEGVRTYLGEMDFAVRPGSDVELCWSLRWAEPGRLAAYVCVDSGRSTAAFSVFRRGQGKTVIGQPVPVPGLQTGRTVKLAAVVRTRQLSLYLDGRLALDVPNDQVPVSGTTPGVELESTDGTGLVRITNLRLYRLGPQD